VGCARPFAPVPRETRVLCCSRLPIDGLHAVIEVGRGSELPFAEQSPTKSDSADGRGDDDNDDQSVTSDMRRGGIGG